MGDAGCGPAAPATGPQTVPQAEKAGTVIDLFEAQAARAPAAIAVSFAGRGLSYRELDRRALAIAHTLRGLGVGRDAVVGISLDRSFDLLISVLAVLKAGGAYLALDPAYPEERLAYILGDAQPQALLTRSSQRAQFPDYRGRVLAVDAIGVGNIDPGGEVPAGLCSAMDPCGRSLAYVVYTSGSTGIPKGVAMEHGPLLNLISWQLRTSRVGFGQRTLQFASLAFDVSFQEIFATWCAGGTLVLIDEPARRDPEALYDLIERQRIARLFLPYVALQSLAVAAARGAAPQSLSEVIVAGEALRITSQIAALFARLPDCTLVNQYGPSEAHVVTAFPLQGEPKEWPALPPIGRPIDNVRVLILDDGRRPAAVGVPGEIYIGGAALARGYLNSPELTDEKFVADRSGNAMFGARLYRTGDLGRLLPDGNIEFLGRLDRQIKLRGYRIEPGEIEVVLAQHQEVRQAVVKLYEPTPGDRRLVAYVVLQPGAQPTNADLIAYLNGRLPPFMVPSTIVFVDAIPVTPSGKIDLAALPEPIACPNPGTATQLPPRNELERRLATIWARVLKVKSVGPSDNFFDVGGDFLLALRLAAEIESAFARTVPLGVIFAAPTIEQLAAMLDRDEAPPAAFSLVPLQTAGAGPPIFFVHWIPRDLVRRLGNERQIYGLAYGLAAQTTDRSEVLPDRVEDIAAQYLDEIRAVQPHGPYTLIGYSAGGLAALEMARQLREQGERVGFLGLIDTLVESRYTDIEIERFPLRVKVIKTLQLPPTEIWLAVKNHPWLLRLRPGSRQAAANRFEDLNESLWNSKLWTAYIPQPYSGAVTLFAATSQWSLTSRYPAVAPAWRELTDGRVEIHEVPGRHLTVVLDPNARVLAAKLRACLERKPCDQAR